MTEALRENWGSRCDTERSLKNARASGFGI
jgi:hypothetical protein